MSELIRLRRPEDQPTQRLAPSERDDAHRQLRLENTPNRFAPGRHRKPETLAVPVPRPAAPPVAPMERLVGEATEVLTAEKLSAVMPKRSAGATLPRPTSLRTGAQQVLANALRALRPKSKRDAA
jgi:hypothetical protein